MRIELKSSYGEKLRALDESPGQDWITLVKAAGEDPLTFFEDRDWTGRNFSQSQMKGISFRGAIVDGAVFRISDQEHLELGVAQSAQGVSWVEGTLASQPEVDFSKLWRIIKSTGDHSEAFGALKNYVTEGYNESVAMHHAVLAKAVTADEAKTSLTFMLERSIPINAITATKAISLQEGFDDALEVFELVERSGEDEDSKLLNALLAKAKTISNINLVRRMRIDRNWLPTTWTLNCELKSAKDFHQALESIEYYRDYYNVKPDVISYRAIKLLCRNREEAQWVEENVRLNLDTLDTRSFNIEIKMCDDFTHARNIFESMIGFGVERDIYTYNIYLTKCDTFDDAISILDMLRSDNIQDRIDDYTLNPLIRLCKNFEHLHNTLQIFDENSVELNEYSMTYLNVFADRSNLNIMDLISHVQSFDQAMKMTRLLNQRGFLPKSYFGSFTKRLAQLSPAKDLLNGCFTIASDIGIIFPFEHFGAAIATYRVRNQINDALRVAMAFPYLEASKKVFRENQAEATAYFEKELHKIGGEPWHASRALAFSFLANGDIQNAKKWVKIAIKYPKWSKKALVGLNEILDF